MDLDCQSCGACCRGTGHGVELAPGEMAARPDLVRVGDGHRSMLRVLGDCVALERNSERWSCSVYDVRPRVCRDFAPGSAACLAAREVAGG